MLNKILAFSLGVLLIGGLSACEDKTVIQPPVATTKEVTKTVVEKPAGTVKESTTTTTVAPGKN